MRVYLAGPDVFHADAARLGMRKKAICSKYGLTGVYPLDNDLSFDGLSPFEQGIAIFQANADLMRGCDATIANMTPFRGPSCDPGTAYEVGFMSGLGKSVAAYTNDPRPFTDRSTGLDTLTVERFGMVDNLMLDGAVHANGLEIIIHDGTDPFLDLDGFDLCCRRLADRLG